MKDISKWRCQGCLEGEFQHLNRQLPLSIQCNHLEPWYHSIQPVKCGGSPKPWFFGGSKKPFTFLNIVFCKKIRSQNLILLRVSTVNRFFEPSISSQLKTAHGFDCLLNEKLGWGSHVQHRSPLKVQHQLFGTSQKKQVNPTTLVEPLATVPLRICWYFPLETTESTFFFSSFIFRVERHPRDFRRISHLPAHVDLWLFHSSRRDFQP